MFRFPLKRLSQLTLNFCQMYPEFDQREVMEHIFIEHVNDSDALWNVITCRLPILISRQNSTSHPIRLIIIDSIASIFRTDENDAKSNIKRIHYLTRLSMELHKLNVDRQIGIVLVSQVTDRIKNVYPDVQETETSSFRENVDHYLKLKSKSNKTIHEKLDPRYTLSCIPCFGLFWANLMTTRISLYRDPQMMSKRMVYIVFSPFLKSKTSEFTIDAQGVHILSSH